MVSIDRTCGHHLSIPRFLRKLRHFQVGIWLGILLFAHTTAKAQGIGLDDSFNAQQPQIWNEEGNEPGVGTLVYGTQGVVLSLEPGSAARGIASTCSLVGDFNVEVGITLIDWPANNLYGMRLGAIDLGGGPFGEIGIYREGGGEFYTVALTNGSVHSATVAADKVNKLRLVRNGGFLSGFFLTNGGANWVQVGGPGAGGLVSTVQTRFNLDLSASNPNAGGATVAFNNFHVNSGTVVCVAPPSSLHATVGNQRVYLDWQPGSQPVDGYNVQVARFDNGIFTPLGTVNSPGFPISTTSFTVFSFANGDFPQNGSLYRFTVTALKNGSETPPSNFVFARPGEFAASQPPPKPANPILFLHGITGSASDWDTMRDFLAGTALWRFGGTLSYSKSNDPRTQSPVSIDFLADQDFYTANFGDNLANYDVGRPGMLHQADEVQGFVLTLFVANSFKKTSIVAHSMGGLAARSYIADQPNEAVRRVSQLTTYGSPHWGVSHNDVATFIGNAISRGAQDTRVDCTSANPDLNYTNEPSPGFLDQLRLKTLPSGIQYFSIRGHNDVNIALLFTLGITIPANQTTLPCLTSREWDGLIALESADLGTIPGFAPAGQPPLTTNPVPLLTTNRVHIQQTNDFSAVLCALDVNCALVTVHSPVDVEITAPDGRSITPELSEIPGASYMELADETGHPIATAVLPFPLGGDYNIKVIPKPGALPTDTYTIEMKRGGVASIVAENQRVQDIPPQPYIVTILPTVGISIKPHIVNTRRNEDIQVTISSTPKFDARSVIDRHTVTFGKTGDEASLESCDSKREDEHRDVEDEKEQRLPNLTCHFETRRTGLLKGDTQAVLKGKTVEGIPFVGLGSVHVVH